MDIALFVFDPLGRVTAFSAAAQCIQERFAQSLSRPAAVAPSPAQLWWRQHWWQVGTVFCWVSFPAQVVQAATGEGDTTWGTVARCATLGAIGTICRRRQTVSPAKRDRTSGPHDRSAAR